MSVPAPNPGPRPVLTLLSDFGLSDVYVGVLHGVIRRVCPEAHIIDVTHEVPAGDILAGALALADVLAYMPVGIHVAVVDPGVGTTRRALALACGDGRVLVGPDNGLLREAAAAAGHIIEAVDIGHSRRRLEPVSATFHGRDIFAPVAAAIASGCRLAEVGVPVDPDTLVPLDKPEPEILDGALTATITAVDRFGNLALLAFPADARRAGLAPGDVITVRSEQHQMAARYGHTFSDVGTGRMLLLEDSTGRLGLAVSGGSAADVLGVVSRTQVRLGR